MLMLAGCAGGGNTELPPAACVAIIAATVCVAITTAPVASAVCDVDNASFAHADSTQ